jgi:hypothetical protein
MSRDTYDEINRYAVEHAALRGSKVHAYCETLDRREAVDIEDSETELIPYLKAYIKFHKEHCVAWADVEALYHHTIRLYAGTIDRRGTVDGKAALLDIKTTASVHKPIVKAQLNGYTDMLESNGIAPVDKLYCLQLMKDGRYRLYEVARDATEFNACYELHTALCKKHGRGIIE